MTLQSMTIENPLLEGLPLDRKVEPLAMVIFGAHGDLAKRKLIPALYALYLQGMLPKGFALVGSSRTVLTDEQFRSMMKESVQKYASDLTFEEATWSRFEANLFYRAGNLGEVSGYTDLQKLLEELKESHGTMGNHIFYLSTPPSLYEPIITNLAKCGLAYKRRATEPAWPRVVVEKPFGRDLESARHLDLVIHDVLREHQVYRIDHYLGKETVQNIMVFRFANGLFEPLWNRQYIDHIQITNAEILGVENRAPYYEEAGAIRDMMQNHLMQLVALVGMEPPISMDSESTRDERMKVLKAIRPFTEKDIDERTVRGQYGPGFIQGEAVKGYRTEDRVNPQSTTETFVALKLFVDNWRLADVPIYVRTGKRLPKTITEIAVQFKPAPHSLFASTPDAKVASKSNAVSSNVLVMQIQPDEGISLRFATKQPGPGTDLRWLNMDFKYGTAFGARTPSAYERLILDCLVGDPSLFARTDFVDASWALLEPVVDKWWGDKRNAGANFPNYEAGSWGPSESDAMLAKDGRVWRRL